MKLFSKLLTLFVWVRHAKIDSQRRWFIRFYYLGTLNQFKFYCRDYITKRPYKEIKYFGEFQQEILYALPHAYWHYKNGTLKKTISSKQTAPFYFFSPNHEERYITRKWKGNFNINFPNAPHNHKLNRLKWMQVPIKEQYANDEFLFDKPLLVIANRFNTEWNQSPISYFDIPCLEMIISQLSEKFQIVYNRPGPEEITNDNSEVKDLSEKEFLRKKHPNILILSDMWMITKNATSFNEMQLKIYANCSNFISIHGGTAALASYFGGNNVIYSKRGHEHHLNEFENIFTELANTNIHHVKSYNELYDKIGDVFTR